MPKRTFIVSKWRKMHIYFNGTKISGTFFHRELALKIVVNQFHIRSQFHILL